MVLSIRNDCFPTAIALSEVSALHIFSIGQYESVGINLSLLVMGCYQILYAIA